MQTPVTDPFQAIADPSRRQILHLLSNDSMTINALADNFDMSRPAVSKHIKILYSAGFISIEDIGRERYCTLNQEGFNELQQWIDYFDTFWQERLKRLDVLMRKH
jgi:DNA-binding transcriptional ArsR family regulator